MSTTGPTIAGTGADALGSGPGIWTNPGNVTANDTTYATIGVSSMASPLTSNYLLATNFGFAIASDQVIDGIEVTVGRFADVSLGTGGVVDDSVKLVIGGTVSGSDIDTGAAWSTSLTTDTIGGSTELGGLTPTYSDVNASNFGVAIKCVVTAATVSVTAKIDWVKITIHHSTGTPPDAVGPVVATFCNQDDGECYMQKNVAGQKVGAQLIDTAGAAFTSSVTVSVTGDAGTQATGSVGSGACTHEGNGYHTYAPAQAETNYDLVAFTFTGTGAIPVTVQRTTRMDANVVAGAATADLTSILGTSITEGASGRLAAAFTAFLNVASPVLNVASVNQTGDSYAKVDTEVGTLVSDVAAIKAKTDNLPTDPADASDIATSFTTVNGKLDAIDDYVDTEMAAVLAAVDTEVAAIKAKTDQLVFTVANRVDATATLSAAESDVISSGTATAGGANTITLQTALGANDLCNGALIKIASGTGAKQTRRITDYVDSTQVATVNRNWTTNPDNTSVYAITYADLTAGTVVRFGAALTSTAGVEVRGCAYLERDGNVVVLPSGSCTVAFREHGAGADLFSVTDSAPNAQGIFEVTQATPGFTSDRLYLVTATITDDLGNVFTSREPVPCR
jgi:hypothetical protein